jgi:hypothetical protein
VPVPDWETISSLATAGGTLVLAVATFSAVRSANRSARVAERAFLTGTRPLLLPSLFDDPAHKVLWNDRHAARVAGGHAIAEEAAGVIYLAMGLRNVGPGLALLHGWFPRPALTVGDIPHPEPPDFRRLTVDLYVPPGGTGYWEGAIRDPADPVREGFLRCLDERSPFTIELLYGDEEGGQRRISRFTVLPAGEEGWYCQGGRHWNVDLPDPR